MRVNVAMDPGRRWVYLGIFVILNFMFSFILLPEL